MKEKKLSLKQRFNSFSFALNGLKIVFNQEPNALIHLIVTGLVVVLGFVFHIKSLEWIALIFAIGLVFSLELVNTAIERLGDHVTPEKNEQIKIIKDLSAAAVLVGVLAAVCIGMIIFIPKVFYF